MSVMFSSPRASDSEEKNARSVCVVLNFWSCEIAGGVFEFKVRKGGEVVGIKDDEDELKHVSSFFKQQGIRSTFVTCAGHEGSSKLHLLLNPGSKFSHSLDGITYNTKTMAHSSFKRPLAYKKTATLISAYGKLYYLASPSSRYDIPNPSFERYDPLKNSWESLCPFPFYTAYAHLSITGYVVFLGCIFLSLGDYCRTKFMTFHIATQRWYEVEASDSQLGYVSYAIDGRGVVVGDTVYALASTSGQIILLSFEVTSDAVGYYKFSVRATFLPGWEEIRQPPYPYAMLGTICLVYMGDFEFCIVQTGFTDRMNMIGRQHLCITTVQIVDEDEPGMKSIRILHSSVCQVLLPGHGACINFGFSPDCDDYDAGKEWILDIPSDDEDEDFEFEESVRNQSKTFRRRSARTHKFSKQARTLSFS